MGNSRFGRPAGYRTPDMVDPAEATDEHKVDAGQTFVGRPVEFVLCRAILPPLQSKKTWPVSDLGNSVSDLGGAYRTQHRIYVNLP